MVPCPGAVLIMLYAVANDMIYPGFILVAAMSIGIGVTICGLGVGAILARQTATRLVESSVGGGGVNVMRHTLNFTGATIVTLDRRSLLRRISRRAVELISMSLPGVTSAQRGSGAPRFH